MPDIGKLGKWPLWNCSTCVHLWGHEVLESKSFVTINCIQARLAEALTVV